MVSDGGGRFISAGMVGLHTLSSLLASLVAHDRATRKITIHTTQEESLILTSRKEHYSWVQYISLDKEVLTPSP